MTLKLYDHGTGTELNYVSNNIIEFEGNGTLGSAKEPYQINFSSPVVNVAKIGDVEYTSLQEAENAAKDDTPPPREMRYRRAVQPSAAGSSSGNPSAWGCYQTHHPRKRADHPYPPPPYAQAD